MNTEDRRQITFFTPHFPSQESVYVLQAGYEKSLPGHFSVQKSVDLYVLHCITSGRGVYKVNEQTYSLTKNDLFLLLPGVPISYQSDIKDPWAYYWIGFTGTDLPQLLAQCCVNNRQPVCHYPDVRELAELIRPLIGTDTRLLSTNYQASSALYRIFSKLVDNSTQTFENRKEYYSMQAMAYIKDNLANPLAVNEIARRVGLERTYLYRLFKEYTGMNIQEYILKIRIEHACDLLRYSTCSLSQIASLCGYSSLPHFSSQFKQKKGISPSDYRKGLS